MKTNSTFLKYAVLLIVVLAFSIQVKATPPSSYNFSFNSVPSAMQASTAFIVGNKFKFGSVASGTDAIVTILSATGGATVALLDDNTTTKPEAFSPKINVPALSTGTVEFKIEFVNGVGNPKVIDTLRATAMDIDGNSTLKEIDALDMGPGCLLSYLSTSLQINVVQTGTQFLATNIAGMEYAGVDTSAKQVMFTLANTNISSFTYKAGAVNLANSSTSRQKGIYFKGFDYVPASTMPVKYSAFDAVVVNQSVVLNWITEQEINNNHFEVERSFDGVSFTTTAMVLDGFENGSKKNYQFKDNDAVLQTKAVVYYRLKQVDNDGKGFYTNTLVVKLKAAEGVVIQTSPNPFTENLNIRFTSTGNAVAEISIINANGQQVLSKKSNVSKGYNNIQVGGLTTLAPGMYVAQLKMNGVVTGTQKIIKN
ncbi:T9SS type A sorting domain-containing protein [Ferruginibacter sp.]|nr:T9SS type A sorting domain-containing protein [Ferruginibacter sp.]